MSDRFSDVGSDENRGLAKGKIKDPETEYDLARKISELQNLRSENFFMGNAIRGILLNAYGWWLVGSVARVAGVGLIGIGIGIGIGSVLGFLGFRLPRHLWAVRTFR